MPSKNYLISPINLNDDVNEYILSNYEVGSFVDCEGSIDEVNKIDPAPSNIQLSADVLLVRGWLVLSGRDGTVPDEIFVTLTKAGEEVEYIQTERYLRPDIETLFHQFGVLHSGYTAIADISELHGQYILGLAKGNDERLEQCNQQKISLNIKK